MAKFRATARGYYGDVIHDPDTDHHVIFEAPDDFECSWAVKVDDDTPVQAITETKPETVEAEAILEAEAEAAAPADMNEEAGVETL